MKLLLDTHVLLWALYEPARLSENVAEILSDGRNELVISAASMWEISIKHRKGKLPQAAPLLLNYGEDLRRFRARDLGITTHHTIVAGQLEWRHKDLFDRMLAAQSILEMTPLVTKDPAFRGLAGLQTIWG